MKKFVLVGTGNRALGMFAKPIATAFANTAQLAGVYDVNRLRAEQLSRDCGDVRVYDTFEDMLSAHPDATVIVATVDYTHDEYIIRALDRGHDVISEKPMTINHKKTRAIIEAEKRSGKKVTVTFNERFIPYMAKIKQLLMEGTIGDVMSVHLEWLLDTSHGADYFRRWHRYMDKSGGLLVHKSTHHFDLVNWWLDDEPFEVFAYGSRQYYGPTRERRGQRCLTCSFKKECEFYLDLKSDPFWEQYYLQAESADGYHRDGCVFSEDIDIYDTMSVNAMYSRGAHLNYSLNAHCPYEGWRLSINGKEGRLEGAYFYSGPESTSPTSTIRILNRAGEDHHIKVKKMTGEHGGSDRILRQRLFGEKAEDPLKQMAGSRAGAMSLLIGDAANISIAEGQPVFIRALMGETTKV